MRVYDATFAINYDAIANNFGAPSTGVWYMIHGWHSSSADQVGIAVNAGTANTTSTGTDAPADSDAPFWVGALNASSPTWFADALIDDLAYWKNRVLDASDRTADYNGGTGLACPSFTAPSGGSPGVLLLLMGQ